MFWNPQDLLLMIDTEIFNIDASWAQKFTKTESAILIRANCIHLHKPLQLSCPPPLILPSSIRRSRVQTRPPPPEQWWSDGVGRAGTVLLLIVRMWLTLGPVLSLYWEQEQGQDHTNTAQSLLIMRLITSAVQCSIGSTTGFHYHRGGPTTSAFTFKTLLRHYAK